MPVVTICCAVPMVSIRWNPVSSFKSQGTSPGAKLQVLRMLQTEGLMLQTREDYLSCFCLQSSSVSGICFISCLSLLYSIYKCRLCNLLQSPWFGACVKPTRFPSCRFYPGSTTTRALAVDCAPCIACLLSTS